LDRHTLTINTTGNGSVAKSPDQPTYSWGTVVALTATAAPGWSFSSWSGDLSGSANPDNITIDGNKTVTATFTMSIIDVKIDIKPGSDPNSINIGSKGVVPIALLTTADFDASRVNPATVKFADAAPVHGYLRMWMGTATLTCCSTLKWRSLTLQNTAPQLPLPDRLQMAMKSRALTRFGLYHPRARNRFCN